MQGEEEQKEKGGATKKQRRGKKDGEGDESMQEVGQEKKQQRGRAAAKREAVPQRRLRGAARRGEKERGEKEEGVSEKAVDEESGGGEKVQKRGRAVKRGRVDGEEEQQAMDVDERREGEEKGGAKKQRKERGAGVKKARSGGAKGKGKQQKDKGVEMDVDGGEREEAELGDTEGDEQKEKESPRVGHRQQQRDKQQSPQQQDKQQKGQPSPVQGVLKGKQSPVQGQQQKHKQSPQQPIGLTPANNNHQQANGHALSETESSEPTSADSVLPRPASPPRYAQSLPAISQIKELTALDGTEYQSIVCHPLISSGCAVCVQGGEAHAEPLSFLICYSHNRLLLWVCSVCARRRGTRRGAPAAGGAAPVAYEGPVLGELLHCCMCVCFCFVCVFAVLCCSCGK